jgi:hypothetical protein
MDFHVLYDSYGVLGIAWLIGGPDDFFVIAIGLSLQCSLIITQLAAILEKMPKKK